MDCCFLVHNPWKWYILVETVGVFVGKRKGVFPSVIDYGRKNYFPFPHIHGAYKYYTKF